MRTDILCYSCVRGKLTGISLEGSILRPDDGANKNLYGRDITAEGISLDKSLPVPGSAKNLLVHAAKNLANQKSEGCTGINRYSPGE